MSDFKKDSEDRRDYGHGSEKQYSSAGRVLRPRKNAGSARKDDSFAPRSERVDYSSSRGEGRPYGDRKPYSSRKSYGDHKPYGEHKSSGEGRPYGEHKPFKSRSFGEGKPYAGRKSFGEGRPTGERKPYGEGKPYGKKSGAPARKPYRKAESFSDDRLIEGMLEGKPQVDRLQYSDFDAVSTPVKDEIRLNKFIANSGVCSRREADTMIQAGVVTVNGEVVTELGTKVNIHTDDVRFNGERLRGEEKVYVVMNKPKGYVTTASDPHAEKTVMELLKGCNGRVFPVGRLDKNTTGVLMFTNDGEIAERLTHPSYDKKKIYQVLLDRPLSQEDFARIKEGIELSDGPIKADEIEFIEEGDHRKIGIEIHSGKNRIVRRIFEACGYDVRALDRVYFAGLTKKGLKKGEWRYLSEGEVNILKMGAYV